MLDDRVKQRVPFRLLQFHLRYYFFFRPAHCAYMSTIQVMLVNRVILSQRTLHLIGLQRIEIWRDGLNRFSLELICC